jgi:formate dehydrogenase major subunit
MEYPFLLTTGRSLYQFNAGTMTARTPNRELRPVDTVDMSPADAGALAVHEGDRVRLVSRSGATILPVCVTTAVAAGQLFATFHTAQAFVNQVTGPHRDSRVGTPEYKVTAVRVERVAEGAP